MKPLLELTQVGIEFKTPKGPFCALDNVNLKIAEGEFVSLIGHSGCSKSTVLNIVAGLLQATTGGVVLDGREVNEPGPERAVVFQNHALLPWLTVYENVELAVRQVFRGRKSRADMRAWTEHALALVHMSHARDKRPAEISGGMKQRVGIARALAMEPKVLLMDEPFAALDSQTRDLLLVELQLIWAKTKKTIVFITHNITESICLGDRVIVFSKRPGRIKKEIAVNYRRPRLPEDDSLKNYHRQVVDAMQGEITPDKKDG